MWSFMHCLWKCKIVQPLWKTVWQVLKKKTKPVPTIQTSNCYFWTIIPEKWKPVFTKKTCTRVLIAGLFIIVRNWRHPRWCSTDEWLNKLDVLPPYQGILFSNKKDWTVHTYSNLERSQGIMLSENCMSLFIKHSSNNKVIKTDNRLALVKG